MTRRTTLLRLADILAAAEGIAQSLKGKTLEQYKNDWPTRAAIERGFEIISEASRHLAVETKDRHPDIPWAKVAAIGNILRHEYHRVAADALWALAHDELLTLAEACRAEFARLEAEEGK